MDKTSNFLRFTVDTQAGTGDGTITATLQTGTLPDTPFNLLAHKSLDVYLSVKDEAYEFVRVTAVSGSAPYTLTVTRAQEDTSAVIIEEGWFLSQVASDGFFDQIRTSLDNKLGATEQAVDSAKLEGNTLSQVLNQSKYDDSQLRENLNNLYIDFSYTQFELNLQLLDYSGGFFDIFDTLEKIALDNNVVIDPLDPDGTGTVVLDDTGVFGDIPKNEIEKLIEPAGTVYSVAFNHDGSLLAVGSGNNEVHIYDTSTWTEIELLTEPTNWVYSVAFNPDGSRLAVGTANNEVHIYDTSTWTEIELLTEPASNARSVAFNSNGSLLAVGSGNNEVHIYDTSTWTEIELLTEPTNRVYSLVFNPDGSLLAVGTYQNVHIYDTSTWTEIELLTEPAHYANSVAFNPDGSLLAVGSQNNEVHIYDTSTWTEIEKLTEPANFVYSVDFNHDGSLLAVGTRNNEVHIYDTSTWTEIEKLTEPTQNVYSVAFNPDGSLLAVGTRNNEVHIYQPNLILFDSGSITSTIKDLSEDGITNLESVVLTDDVTLPSTTDITYKVIDNDNNEVSISRAQVGDEIDISAFTSNNIKIEATLHADEPDTDNQTPTLKSYAIHFK